MFEEQQVWLEHGSSAGETGGGGLTSERWRVGAGRLVPLGLVGRVTLKPVLSEPGSRKAAGRFRLRPLERFWQGWD